jgi:hypothetical protein
VRALSDILSTSLPTLALSPPPRADSNGYILYNDLASERMDKAQRDDLIRLITSPPAGSKIAAAKDFGIDLTLLLRMLELTPTERLQKLASAQEFFQQLRDAKRTSAHE